MNDTALNLTIKMKKLLLSTILPAITLMALNATAAPPPSTGPVTISWKVMQSPPEEYTNVVTIIKKGTNDVGTNSLSAFKSKIITTTFDNAEVLALLGHSLSNSFTGDALAVGVDNIIYVVKGTNIVTNASIVLSVMTSNTVYSGAGSYGQTVEKTGTNSPTTTYSGSSTYTQVSYVKVSYDDSSLITDGTASTFSFVGLSTGAVDATVNKTNGIYAISQNFSLSSGAGVGTIRGTNSVISGSVTGSVKYSE